MNKIVANTKSDCCGAKVEVILKFGGWWYKCMKCGKACNNEIIGEKVPKQTKDPFPTIVRKEDAIKRIMYLKSLINDLMIEFKIRDSEVR